MRNQSIRRFSFLLLALTVGVSSHAAASPRHDARTDRLRGLTKADLKIIASHLDRGPVALVEFANKRRDELPAVNLAAYIRAPASVVADVVSDPGRYPEFMRILDEVEIVQKNGAEIVYDWQWQLGIFTLGGRNTMRVYAPPVGRPGAGYRVTADSLSGDLGAGRFSLRILNLGPSKSLLVMSLRLDMRRANYVVRQLAKASRSINRSANIAVACSTFLAIRRAAEARAGHRLPSDAGLGPHRTEVEARQMLPLLRRGDLVFFDMSGDRLGEITVAGQIGRPRAVVWDVMLDPSAFRSALVPGSHATVVSQGDGVRYVDWGVDLPLVGASGRILVRDDGKAVSLKAISGALRGSHWQFEARPMSKDSTLVVGWTSFDMRDSSWLLEHLIAADPYLGYGFAAAADIMLMRTLRSRSRKRQTASP